MKKIVCLCCVVLACMIALTGMAAAEDTRKGASVTLAPGGTIELMLKLTGKAAGMQAQICWDPALVELTDDDVDYTADFRKGSMIAMINHEPEKGMISLVYVRQEDLAAEGMDVLPLSFRVKADAAGETEIAIRELQLVDADNKGVEADGEGLILHIGAGDDTPYVPETNANAKARLYLEYISSENPEVVPTGEPTIEPSTEPEVGPTEEPAYEPSVNTDSFALRTRNAADGVIVELIAENVVIGGFQAEICYDASVAELRHASFSEEFIGNSMIQMINDEEPGRISLVYSNLSGYYADGSAIFSALFSCDDAEYLVFTLENAKFTGTDMNLTATDIAYQMADCEIQPMEDLTVIEEDGVRIVEISGEHDFSLTVDPGESVALRLKGYEIPEVCWISDRADVADVTPEGLVEARSSGLAVVAARNIKDGKLLAEGRICVRNAQFGLPVEILELSVSDADGETFALAATDGADYAARGITLVFRDGENIVRLKGLLPENMDSLPGSVFDLCGNLTEVEIAAANIAMIESGAFWRCESLEKITLWNSSIEIHEEALPLNDQLTLCIPWNSTAIDWAEQNDITIHIIESVGDMR